MSVQVGSGAMTRLGLADAPNITSAENLSEIRKAAHYLQKLTEVLEKKGGL